MMQPMPASTASPPTGEVVPWIDYMVTMIGAVAGIYNAAIRRKGAQ